MKHLFKIAFLCLILVLAQGQCFATDSTSSELGITLEDLLNTEISTATKYDKKVSEVPASVTIISSEDIERYGYENLAEALSRVPGFYISYDRNYYYLGTRGFSRPTDYNNRVKVLLNGHSMNENYYGSAGLGVDLVLNLNAVERIEVVQGPGSALYGTGAMFAVVNIITKTSEQMDGLQVTGYSGSFGEEGTTAMFNTELSPRARLSLSGAWTDIDGPDLYFPEFDQVATNYGVAEAKDWARYHGFTGAFQYDNLTISGYYSNGEKGVPTGAWDSDFNHDQSYTLDRLTHIEAKYNLDVASTLNLNLRGHYNDYYYTGGFPYGGFMTWDANWGAWMGSEAQVRWDVHPSNRIVGGVEYQNSAQAEYRYWGEDGEVYYEGDIPYDVVSLYLQNEFQALYNLSFTVGVRHDEYSITGSHTSPRAAIVYHPLEVTTVKLLYGRAFRAPSIYEAFYEDPLSDYRSNHDLRPEDITTYEVLVEQEIGKRVLGKLSLYSYKMNDLIDYYEHPTDGWLQYQNIGGASANGIETELQVRLPGGTSAYANYAYENAKDVTDDERLSNSPTHLLNAGISSPLARHLAVGTSIHYESERRTVYDTNTDPFFIANVNLTAAPKLDPRSPLAPVLNRARLSLAVKNLFDQEYATPGGYEHLQDQLVQDGRTFRVKIAYTF